MNEAAAEEDLELAAMSGIGKLLSPLEPDARSRVMAWVCAKFGLERTMLSSHNGQNAGTREVETPASPNDTSLLKDLATLLEAASPTSDKERLLVAAYWMQEIQKEKVTAIPINKQLTQFGYPVSHISQAFDILITQKPALVLQTHKSGSTKQAKRTYKLTAQGIKAAKALLSRQPRSEE